MLTLERERRGARDHFQAGTCDKALMISSARPSLILVLRVRAHVGEREHRDRRLRDRPAREFFKRASSVRWHRLRKRSARLLGQAPAHDAFSAGGAIERGELVAQTALTDPQRRRAAKRAGARQHLVEDAPEAEDVGS